MRHGGSVIRCPWTPRPSTTSTFSQRRRPEDQLCSVSLTVPDLLPGERPLVSASSRRAIVRTASCAPGAHQSLATDAASYRALSDRTDTDAAERYLNSNWQLPSARPALTRFVEGLWRLRWFREFMREVGNGRFRIMSLLRAAGDLSSKLSATKAESLQDLGAKLATPFDARSTRAARSRRSPIHGRPSRVRSARVIRQSRYFSRSSAI